MTTIGYKDGIIAYDSRMTGGGGIITDNFEKKVILGNSIVFYSGSIPDRYRALLLYSNGVTSKQEHEPEGSALIVEGDSVLLFSFKDGYPYTIKIDYGMETIGSGWQFARAAMEMGASAYEAVLIAKRIDPFTGGDVKIFEIGKN